MLTWPSLLSLRAFPHGSGYASKKLQEDNYYFAFALDKHDRITSLNTAGIMEVQLSKQPRVEP